MFKQTLRQKKENAGYLFILPWLLGFLFLFLFPAVQSFIFSMQKLKITPAGYETESVGWSNYADALTVNPNFNRILTESVMQMASNVPLILIFSLFAAILVNGKFPGRAFARAIFFLPVILTAGVILKMQKYDWMENMMQAAMNESTSSDFGSVPLSIGRYLLEAGLNNTFVGYITDAIDRIYSIINASGVQILIFLAALQSVPSSLYEAADMEGATRWEAFWKITFPIISPFLLANAIYTMIDSFIFVDNEMMELIYDTAFSQSNLGGSAAMAWIYLGVIGGILGIVVALASRKVFYQESR